MKSLRDIIRDRFHNFDLALCIKNINCVDMADLICNYDESVKETIADLKNQISSLLKDISNQDNNLPEKARCYNKAIAVNIERDRREFEIIGLWKSHIIPSYTEICSRLAITKWEYLREVYKDPLPILSLSEAQRKNSKFLNIRFLKFEKP